MKTIKNNGNKIVNIGTQAVMPGAEVSVADIVAETPAIKILAQRGTLTISETERAAKKTTAKKTTKKKTETVETAETAEKAVETAENTSAE